MIVKFVKLDPKAKTPVRKHNDDFCYDVYAVSKKRIGWRTWEYKIGIAFQIEPGNYPLKDDSEIAITLRSRSSIYESGMVLTNGIGTVDKGYTGGIKAIFYNINPFKRNYRVGDRVGQIHIDVQPKINGFVEVSSFDTTERGSRGFGSTGIR